MNMSILLKIGVTGFVLSLLSSFIPILAALFDNDSLNKSIHKYINETNMTMLRLVFAAMIFIAILKKSEESSS